MAFFKSALAVFEKADPVIQLVMLIVFGLFLWLNFKRKAPKKDQDTRSIDPNDFVRREDCHNHIDDLKTMMKMQYETIEKKLCYLEKFLKEFMKLNKEVNES